MVALPLWLVELWGTDVLVWNQGGEREKGVT